MSIGEYAPLFSLGVYRAKNFRDGLKQLGVDAGLAMIVKVSAAHPTLRKFRSLSLFFVSFLSLSFSLFCLVLFFFLVPLSVTQPHWFVQQRARANQIESMDLVGSVDGCDVIIVDDMIDTAGTLCKVSSFSFSPLPSLLSGARSLLLSLLFPLLSLFPVYPSSSYLFFFYSSDGFHTVALQAADELKDRGARRVYSFATHGEQSAPLRLHWFFLLSLPSPFPPSPPLSLSLLLCLQYFSVRTDCIL